MSNKIQIKRSEGMTLVTLNGQLLGDVLGVTQSFDRDQMSVATITLECEPIEYVDEEQSAEGKEQRRIDAIAAYYDGSIIQMFDPHAPDAGWQDVHRVSCPVGASLFVEGDYDFRRKPK